jgi:hypothetical protein
VDDGRDDGKCALAPRILDRCDKPDHQQLTSTWLLINIRPGRAVMICDARSLTVAKAPLVSSALQCVSNAMSVSV